MALTSISQGIAGLTERDVKLVQEGGFHTVESIAYTYVPFLKSRRFHAHSHSDQEERWNKSREYQKQKLLNCLRRVSQLQTVRVSD